MYSSRVVNFVVFFDGGKIDKAENNFLLLQDEAKAKTRTANSQLE